MTGRGMDQFKILIFVSFLALCQAKTTDCNELEALINAERNRYGLASLDCDDGMRYVAWKHVTNQMENNFGLGGHCNLHSWAGELACCYTSDHGNSNCMWDKPKEIYGASRKGFEISTWTSGVQTAKGALDWWRGSQGHYGVLMTRGQWWQDLSDFGCWVGGNYAHCWFAK